MKANGFNSRKAHFKIDFISKRNMKKLRFRTQAQNFQNRTLKLIQQKLLESLYSSSSLFWSGRRDSNSRHPPWQGGTLPAELLPQTCCTSGLLSMNLER
jgi:hypothetical protein